jgi:hypothetical protein
MCRRSHPAMFVLDYDVGANKERPLSVNLPSKDSIRGHQTAVCANVDKKTLRLNAFLREIQNKTANSYMIEITT